jgi:hypothetical protein
MVPGLPPAGDMRLETEIEIRAWPRHGLRATELEVFAVARLVGRRWVRVGLIVGQAPGSHRGLWHTDTGRIHGWNFRLGTPYARRCVTVLAHTRQDPLPVRC